MKRELVISSRPDALPTQPDLIRINAFHAHWLLTQNTENELHIIHRLYADPATLVPHWLTNKVSLQSAFKTLKAMREQLIKKQFRRSPLASIVGKC